MLRTWPNLHVRIWDVQHHHALMSASNLPSLTETFPTKLLEEIFLLTSAQDILWLAVVRNVTDFLESASLLSI